jgi:hypothetical protein
MSRNGVIGVSDHGGWAVLVTADRNGTLLDRRRVELMDEGLPKIPHHVEAQGLPLDEAVALVERVRASAERRAKVVLEEVASAARIVGIALRACPELPPTVAERITDYRARNIADWVMYRRALAGAAEGRGWAVHWYDSRRVFGLASRALVVEDLDAYFAQLRRSLGPPWGQDQKTAFAAAVAVMGGERVR